MIFDLRAAVAFMPAHARILDRRRLQFFLGEGDAAGVLPALDAYRNPDGGYGWSLEPDLRAPESQPAAAMHALEVLAEVGAAAQGRGRALCDWLQEHALPDGGLPIALPIRNPVACAPFWAQGNHAASSLQMTAQVAARAHVVARQDPAVAAHPWLTTATQWCMNAIAALDSPHAYELLFAVRFLDTAADAVPAATVLLDRLKRHVPSHGSVPVEGGAAGESLQPLDFAPDMDRPARSLFSRDVIRHDIDRLAGLQQPDGGWVVDFPSFSPAAALEWRGYATTNAVMVLSGNTPPWSGSDQPPRHRGRPFPPGPR